ncbi:MAG: phosphoribosylformylglycinamidine cyclo-ligase [Desulfobacterales bacterium]|nr:phosphoribosylformylglycinamidine cyclo-ligase [Desulfobacterales bacterium]
MDKTLTYTDAGVDIDKADRFVQEIKKIAKQTSRSGVMGDIGGFGGLFSLNVSNMERPVLVSSTDGVGTKLKIAFMLDQHDSIGIDLVGMCINDIAVQGAKPLFFLDYLSMGTLDTRIAKEVVTGIGEGCRMADCALIGGETAEMPGFYKDNEYDLAGFAVGIVDNNKIVDGSETRVGDKLIGIASSGLHSNGYSLVRKVCFDILKLDVHTHIDDFGRTLGEELLEPTRIYADIIRGLRKGLPINGLAHITGGGIPENVVRIIPQTCSLVLLDRKWEVPPIFSFLQAAGNISDQEMRRAFNNGIGLVVVVEESFSQELLERLAAMDEKAYVIGEVIERKESVERIQWV